MRLFVPAETQPGEKRVALMPEVVGKFTKLGFTVTVQADAGEHAYAPDADYVEAGAEVVPGADREKALAAADVVASVRPLPDVDKLSPGAIALSFLQPGKDTEAIAAASKAGVTLVSFDLIPRISRAQSMDALTSQALVTGYRSALVGADLLPKFFPLFMTAAGTIPPAKVLVLGAGVAGLQAIATAKRLGAKVSAYDVRPASKDEVKSMGGTFIELELDSVEGSGGYAREMTQDRAARQQELLTPYVAESDVVITTAAVPGRTAPRLVTEEMVAAMKPGAVVVDLAAESGGNVAGSEPGQVITKAGVRIWGAQDVASEMPEHASKLYSMNVAAVVGLMVTEDKAVVDVADEVFDSSAVVLDGEIRNETAREAVGEGQS